KTDNGGPPELCWLVHGHYTVKGADEPIQVCEVGVVGQSPLRPPADRAAKPDFSRANAAECPYRGLERFEVEHAPLFFGRDDLTRTPLDRIAAALARPGRRFLAIEGASGSGKSSLSRAGLLAHLKNGGLEHSALWPQAIMMPGDDPLHRLAVEIGRVL